MKYKNIIFQKKAELTTQQIVMIIVLLASFVVLLLFLLKVNFQDISEKEICQSSVQLAAKIKAGFFSGKIDCKIHYLCISGGGECTGFTYRDTAKININDKDKAKNEIMKIIVDEMANCWWMFGEGKVDYSGGAWFGDSAVCAVCTQFAFDEKIKKLSLEKISYKEIYELERKNKQTYASYFGLDISKMDGNYLARTIDVNKKYSIYTGRIEFSLLSKGLSWITPGITVDTSITPLVFEREDSQSIKCSSFVTTP